VSYPFRGRGGVDQRRLHRSYDGVLEPTKVYLHRSDGDHELPRTGPGLEPKNFLPGARIPPCPPAIAGSASSSRNYGSRGTRDRGEEDPVEHEGQRIPPPSFEFDEARTTSPSPCRRIRTTSCSMRFERRRTKRRRGSKGDGGGASRLVRGS